MKKLLLALVVVLTFGSAVAKVNNDVSLTKAPTISTSAAVGVNQFVLKKANLNLTTLNIENLTVASGQSCETGCLNSFRNCQAAGFPWCFRALTQCIDQCEGAGGLYQ